MSPLTNDLFIPCSYLGATVRGWCSVYVEQATVATARTDTLIQTTPHGLTAHDVENFRIGLTGLYCIRRECGTFPESEWSMC